MKRKFSSIFLGIFLLCHSIYAANTDEASLPLSNDINLTAPQQQQGSWSVGITGGLMQSSTNTNIPNNTANHNTLAGGDVSYGFPNSGNDASVSYERGNN
jgi:hypothetical protein